ncbi:MAG: O-antigen ligase family protein [Bacteroidales bacterium]|nr:O-antigen ligase family protein [Bacteroidales bacterium]
MNNILKGINIFRKMPAGNRFVFISISLFVLFWIIVKIIFSNYNITDEENKPVLRLVSLSFLALNLIVALILFPSKPLKISFKEDNILNFALLALLISSVLSVKASAYITFLFFVVTLVYALVNKRKFRLHPFFGIMVAYYSYQLLGLLWTIDINEGLKFIDKGLSFIVIPLSFSFFSISKEQRDKVLRLFFRFLTVYLLMGIIGYIFQVYFHKLNLFVGLWFVKFYFPPILNLVDSFDQIFSGIGYGHPTYISFILTVMIAVGFYLSRNGQDDTNGITKFELTVYLVLSAFVIFILKSRLGFIMFPFGVLISVLFTVRKSKQMPFILIFLFVLAILTSILSYKYTDQHSFMNDSDRKNIFSFVVDYIKNNPLTGTGTGSMAIVLRNVEHAVNAHNQFIGELFHLGIGGLIMFLFLIGTVIYHGIKSRNYMLLYFMVIFTLLMITEMPLAIQKGVSAFTLFTCLFLQPDWNIKPDDKSIPQRISYK